MRGAVLAGCVACLCTGIVVRGGEAAGHAALQPVRASLSLVPASTERLGQPPLRQGIDWRPPHPPSAKTTNLDRGSSCNGRLHWGKGGWPEYASCFDGSKEYPDTWCHYGCAAHVRGWGGGGWCWVTHLRNHSRRVHLPGMR